MYKRYEQLINWAQSHPVGFWALLTIIWVLACTSDYYNR